MSLADKARKIHSQKTGRKTTLSFSDEQIEVLKLWLNGELSLLQAGAVLGLEDKQLNNKRSTMLNWALNCIRQGKLRVV